MTILKTDSQGHTFWNYKKLHCSVGKNGVDQKKYEGDGITPLGLWKLEQVFYRPDKVEKPKCILPIIEIKPHDAWCDDANNINYNKHIKLPYNASYENLWRDDNTYDIIVTTNFNKKPIIAAQGSAIFIHILNEQNNTVVPTQGCLGLNQNDLISILENITEDNAYWIVEQ